jgi:hypothetical protein
MNSATTTTQLVDAIQATAAIAEAIRTVGTIPSGHLYAQVLGRMTYETYTSVIALLKRAELVAETSSVLRWVGPVIAEKATR